MCGDATLFIRTDEVEQAWRIVDPYLEAWSEPGGGLHFYPPAPGARTSPTCCWSGRATPGGCPSCEPDPSARRRRPGGLRRRRWPRPSPAGPGRASPWCCPGARPPRRCYERLAELPAGDRRVVAGRRLHGRRADGPARRPRRQPATGPRDPGRPGGRGGIVHPHAHRAAIPRPVPPPTRDGDRRSWPARASTWSTWAWAPTATRRRSSRRPHPGGRAGPAGAGHRRSQRPQPPPPADPHPAGHRPGPAGRLHGGRARPSARRWPSCGPGPTCRRPGCRRRGGALAGRPGGLRRRTPS